MRNRIALIAVLVVSLLLPALADTPATPPSLTLVKAWHGKDGPVMGADFHPKGGQVAFGTQSGVLHVRDLTGNDNNSTLKNAACWVAYSPFVVAANPNGTPLGMSSLVTLAPDSTMTIWFPDTFQRQGYYPDSGTNGALSENGRILAVTFGKMKIHIWHMDHWDPSWHSIKMREPSGVSGRVTTLGLNQNGSVLASGYLLDDGKGALVIWDRLTGKQLNTLPLDQAPGQVCFTPKTKKMLAVVGRNADGSGLVRIISESGDKVVATFPASPSPVLRAAFSHDERYLATGRVDGTIDVWEVASGTIVATMAGAHTGAVRSLAWSHDDALLASGGEDGRMCLWKR